jgi:peptidoglycan/LPS O-acetylase OafA/YrhL
MFMYGALGRGTSVVTDPVTIVLVFLSTIPAGLLLYVLVERPSSRAAGRFPGLVERFATRKGDHGARPPAPQAGSEPLAVVGDRADGGR